MNHYQKYLDLLNKDKIVGGVPIDEIKKDTEKLFSHNNEYVNMAYNWNIKFNILTRDPMFLKLVKLRPNKIGKIIYDILPKDASTLDNITPHYTNLIKLILIDFSFSVDVNPDCEIMQKTSNFKDAFDKNIRKGLAYNRNNYVKLQYNQPAIVPNPIFTPNANGELELVYTRNMIEYFMEVTEGIQNQINLGKKSSTIPTDFSTHTEEDKANIEKMWNLLYNYYSNWIESYNFYYGKGLCTDGTKQAEDDSLYWHLHNNEKFIAEINLEYSRLYDDSITTYLKIRCDDPIKYNQRYNAFVEEHFNPVEEADSRKPQSMYLTGPNPNITAKFYKKKDEKTGVFLDQLEKINNTLYPIDGSAPVNGDDIDDDDLDNYNEAIIKNLIGDPTTNELCYIKEYDYGFLYGPFSRIFKPSLKNSEIASQCFEIKEKFIAGKSILVLGYGASGAGKTSSLIYKKSYNNQPEEKGVLLELLNSDAFDGHTELTVTVHELYTDKFDGKGDDLKNEIYTSKKNCYDNFIFDKVNGDFILSSKNQPIEGFYYEKSRELLPQTQIEKLKSQAIKNVDTDSKFAESRKDRTNWNGENGWRAQFIRAEEIELINEIQWIDTTYKWALVKEGTDTYFTNVNSTDENDDKLTDDELDILMKDEDNILDKRMKWTQNKDDKLGKTKAGQVKITKLEDLILTLVERIRMINPTTNNKTSSRSHVLIYITVPVDRASPGGNKKSLIFGDLAGIENKFVCESSETQSAFLNIPAIDLLTGKKITEKLVDKLGKPIIDEKTGKQKEKERDEPYYTRKSLKFEKIDDSTKLNKEFLNFLKYDARNNLVKDDDKTDYIKNTAILEIAGNVYQDNLFNNKPILDLAQQDSQLIMKSGVGNFIKALSIGPVKWSSPAIKKQFYDYYKNKLPGVLKDKINDQKFIEDYIFNSQNTSILEKIQKNENIKKTSGVEGLCNNRKAEGKFINESLRGMSNTITSIIKNMNADKGLLKNIPLLNASCFKYNCSKYHHNCFNEPVNTDTESNLEIFNDIISIIGEQNKNNIQIVIFGVLNIDRNYNDPQSIPYIDINFLKTIRDQLMTYQYYNVSKVRYNKNIVEIALTVDQMFYCRTDDYNQRQKTIKHNLDTFKDSLKENYKIVMDAYEKIKGPIRVNGEESKIEKYLPNLISLIEKIEMINSMSVIGTMEYINQIKTLFTTDISCGMLDKDIGDHTQAKEDFSVVYTRNILEDNFIRYKNVMDGKTLERVIQNQIINKDNVECTNIIKLRELSIGPEGAAGTPRPLFEPRTFLPATGLGTPTTVIIGGNKFSTEKQELINEYNRLKKMYKGMKSNLV